jgi:hypothetical protein
MVAFVMVEEELEKFELVGWPLRDEFLHPLWWLSKTEQA